MSFSFSLSFHWARAKSIARKNFVTFTVTIIVVIVVILIVTTLILIITTLVVLITLTTVARAPPSPPPGRRPRPCAWPAPRERSGERAEYIIYYNTLYYTII